MKAIQTQYIEAKIELNHIRNEMKRQYRVAVGRLVTSVRDYLASEKYDEILKMHVTDAYIELTAYMKMFGIAFPQFPTMQALKNMDKLFLMRRTKNE